MPRVTISGQPIYYYIGHRKISDLAYNQVESDSADTRKIFEVDPNYRFGVPIPATVSPRLELEMRQGQPILHLAIARQGARSFGDTVLGGTETEDPGLVAAILAQPSLDIKARGYYGQTALHHAVSVFDIKTSRILIARGLGDEEDFYGETAFQKICKLFEYAKSPYIALAREIMQLFPEGSTYLAAKEAESAAAIAAITQRTSSPATTRAITADAGAGSPVVAAATAGVGAGTPLSLRESAASSRDSTSRKLTHSTPPVTPTSVSFQASKRGPAIKQDPLRRRFSFSSFFASCRRVDRVADPRREQELAGPYQRLSSKRGSD